MHRTRSALVRDIAQRHVVTVEPAATLAQCARMLRDEHVGSVIVIEGDRPVGIVTDRDIVLECVAPGLDANAVTAADVMPRTLATVGEADDLIDVLARMREHGVRRIAVVDGSGRLSGILALDDVFSLLAQQLASAAAVVGAEQTKEAATRPAR